MGHTPSQLNKNKKEMKTQKIIDTLIEETAHAFRLNPESDAIHGIALSLMWLENILEPTEYTPASMFVHLIEKKINEINEKK